MKSTRPAAGAVPTALVAGGSSGIGLATARRLLADGFRVAIAGRDERRLASAVAELGDDRLIPIPLDVRDPLACGDVVHGLARDTGRIDVLVNCVGSAPAGTFDVVPDDAWTAAFDGKVLGAVRLMRAVAPLMIDRGHGRIINVAGTAGIEPDAWMAVAGAANAALLAVTKAAALQLAPDGVTVNAVCPGPTRTGRWDGLVSTYAGIAGIDAAGAQRSLEARIPAGHPADAEDVASMIAFLASAEARHVTGTAIPVDGGQSRSW